MRLIVTVITLLLSLSLFGQSKKESKKLLPKPLAKKVWFGMSYDDLNKSGRKLEAFPESVNFRREYLEKIGENGIEQVVYYFTTGGEPKLYEVIIQYYDPKTRDEAAKKIFGEPNYKGTEWRRYSKSFKVMAWTFKNKLVVVGVLPGCEWEGEE